MSSILDIKYVICGKEQTEKGFRYGALYFCKYKTDAWKLNRKINKNPNSKVSIELAKNLKFYQNAATI